MGFPLADWIDSHADLPCNLALSGMRSGLRTVPAALRRPPPPDPAALRRELARTVGVRDDRIFLAHGATEGNTLCLQFLASRLRKRRTLSMRAPRPEYPPLSDIAEWAGFQRRSSRGDVAVLSSPNNPTGHQWSKSEISEFAGDSGPVLVDETFREFSDAPSQARQRRPGLWVTGSFTKLYGADGVRVGYIVAPELDRDRFAEFHGVVTDGLAHASISAARALLAHREEIRGEARGIFRTNLHTLQELVPGAGPLEAPLWFDRDHGFRDGDVFARRLIRNGVLVCPGSFFGDRRGVRVCLTQRTFPRDFASYVEQRKRRASGRRS